ncbi:5'-flap endonuclease [Zalaria obscura]|uniref:5'-flap endonuclease n=1 Tax=Zalaria obscura TaxID=2024903 RepID=A0ACC3S747_9PEZI
MHSSSPGLPSPSALFRTNGPLKSGSRLAQVPKGATIGFATAASVWHKEQQETLETYRTEDTAVDHVGPCESTESVRAPSKGKLVRPKKSTDKAQTRSAQNDSLPEQDSTTISVGQETNKSRENEFSNVQDARRKSVKLSGQGYTRGPSDQAEQGDIILQRKPAKSRRNTKVQGETQPKVKQSRAKNTTSNDPHLVTAEVVEVVSESDKVSTEVHEAEPTGEATASKPKKARARTTKSDKPVKTRKGKASHASATNEQVPDPYAHPVSEKAANNEAHNAPIESVEGQQKSVADTALPEIGDYVPDLAPRRRLSWTPVQDTALPPSFQQSEIETIESPPKTTATFGDLLGNFAYHQADEAQRPPSHDRDVNGEAFTKRRRLDPVEGVNASKEAEDEPKAKGRARAKKQPKESVPKKAKSPKKKATTITELATSAYRPVQLESPSANPTISDFFAPQDQTAEQRESEMRTMVRLAKPKPVRKRPSRAKVAFAEGTEDNASKTTKSKAKSKSAASSSAVESQILYTPQKAQRDMRCQDFLFGTSSQLARDESPTFIRDMQLAMRESENLMSSQLVDSGEATSAAPVPTAPHGTSLTVGQAHRALWSVSARDFDRATLVPDDDLFPPDNLESRGGNAKVEQPSHEEDPRTSSFMEVQDTEGRAAEPTAIKSTSKPHVQVRLEPSDSKDTDNPDSGFVDIDQIPSSVAKDTWAIIADDDSKDLFVGAPDSASATTHQLPRPIASPRRAALQPLDANIPVLQAPEKDPKLAVSASRLISTTSPRKKDAAGPAKHPSQ